RGRSVRCAQARFRKNAAGTRARKNTVPPPRIGIMSLNSSSATEPVATQIATQTMVAATKYRLRLLLTAPGLPCRSPSLPSTSQPPVVGCGSLGDRAAGFKAGLRCFRVGVDRHVRGLLPGRGEGANERRQELTSSWAWEVIWCRIQVL